MKCISEVTVEVPETNHHGNIKRLHTCRGYFVDSVRNYGHVELKKFFAVVRLLEFRLLPYSVQKVMKLIHFHELVKGSRNHHNYFDNWYWYGNSWQECDLGYLLLPMKEACQLRQFQSVLKYFYIVLWFYCL